MKSINPVLYVILNGSLNMSPGKAAAQAVHAAMMLPEDARSEFTGDDRPYKRTVIVLEAKDGVQMDNIVDYVDNAGLKCEYYIDEGKNEVDAFSFTAMAVETIDENDEEAREIFSALPLYGKIPEIDEYDDDEEQYDKDRAFNNLSNKISQLVYELSKPKPVKPKWYARFIRRRHTFVS